MVPLRGDDEAVQHRCRDVHRCCFRRRRSGAASDWAGCWTLIIGRSPEGASSGADRMISISRTPPRVVAQSVSPGCLRPLVGVAFSLARSRFLRRSAGPKRFDSWGSLPVQADCTRFQFWTLRGRRLPRRVIRAILRQLWALPVPAEEPKLRRQRESRRREAPEGNVSKNDTGKRLGKYTPPLRVGRDRLFLGRPAAAQGRRQHLTFTRRQSDVYYRNAWEPKMKILVERG